MFLAKNKAVCLLLIILSSLLVSTAIFAVDRRDTPLSKITNFRPKEISSHNSLQKQEDDYEPAVENWWKAKQAGDLEEAEHIRAILDEEGKKSWRSPVDDGSVVVLSLAPLQAENASYKPSLWGSDVTIAEGPVFDGFSADYDGSGNMYAVRCTTYMDSSNACIRVYKSTDGGASWFYLNGFVAVDGSFKFSYPVVLTGSLGNKLYTFFLQSTQNGDIGMVRLTQSGVPEGFYAVKADADTITYFSACTDYGFGAHLMVAYQEEEMSHRIYTITSTDSGETWGNEVWISGAGAYPDIAYGRNGYAYLVYELTNQPDREIFFGRSTDYCTPFSWSFEMLTDDIHDDTYPKVAALHTLPEDTTCVWVIYNHTELPYKFPNTKLRFALSTNSGSDWTKNQSLTGPSPLRGMESMGIPDPKVQPCDTILDTLWGGTSVAYYWTNPNPAGYSYLNERFDMPGDHGGRLEQIQIAFYEGGSVGTPNPDLYVWSSDGLYPLDNNPPNGAIADFHISYGEITWYPSYTVVETWYQGIEFGPGESFHIGFGHDYVSGDTLAGLSDDGSSGSNRSVEWALPGQWGMMLDDWGIGVDFLINVVICPHPAIPYDEMAADLNVYRSSTSDTVHLCYLRIPTVVRDLTLDVRYTWAPSSSPGQFHTSHQKINDHFPNWAPDGREVCQLTFSKPPDHLPGIVYTGVALKGDDVGSTLGWNLYFDCQPWLTDVEEEVAEAKEGLPLQFSLSANYPNPFNPVTRIQYTVGSKQTQPIHTTLRIYNVLGQLVRTLVNEPQEAGTYEVIWNGEDENGNEVASGIYFYRLQAEDFTKAKKMLLLK